MTAIQKKPDNPIAHLTPEDIEQLGVELDAIRQDVLDTRGERDAAYIRKVIKTQRSLELGSRAVLLAQRLPAGLGRRHRRPVASPRSSRTWRSATTSSTASGTGCATPRSTPRPGSGTCATPAEQWKHSHNELHHTYTNVDRQGQRPRLRHHARRRGPAAGTRSTSASRSGTSSTRCFFEYGIAAYDLELGADDQEEADQGPRVPAPRSSRCSSKIRKQATKDYVVHPALSIPTGSFLPTLAANFTANVVRNLWSHSVIMCGHFPEGVETFEKRSIEGETRGEWYVRQMLGSANISGSQGRCTS